MKRWAIILLSAFALTSCVHYQPRPLDAQGKAEIFEARRLDDAGLSAFIATNLVREHPRSSIYWPRKTWDLETLTLAAYYFQPSLDVARAQWSVAKAAAISAGARPNPTVSFSPGFTANPAGAMPWFMAGGFDWPVETAGKRGLRVIQAQHLVRVAHLNLHTTAWQVRAKVRDNFASLSSAVLQAHILDEKVSLQQELVAKLEERLKAGVLSLPEVLPARVALSRIESELLIVHENEADATGRLAAVIGIPFSVLRDAPKFLAHQSAHISDEEFAKAKQRALLNRSDLLAALADYDASETALRLEIAKQYPDLHFNPNYEYDQGANKWRLGVSLDLPMLNRNQGTIAEARAKRDESAARFTALQAEVIGEIDASMNNHRRAVEQIQSIGAAQDVDEQRAEALAAQIQAGAADPLDLTILKLEQVTRLVLEDEAASRAEQALGRLEAALQQVLGTYTWLVAPAPPEHLERNPREEKTKE